MANYVNHFVAAKRMSLNYTTNTSTLSKLNDITCIWTYSSLSCIERKYKHGIEQQFTERTWLHWTTVSGELQLCVQWMMKDMTVIDNEYSEIH